MSEVCARAGACVRLGQGARPEGASSDRAGPSPLPQPRLSAGGTRVTGLSKERVRVFVGLAPPLTLSCPRHPLPLPRWPALITHPPRPLPTISGHPPLEDSVSPHTPAVRPELPSSASWGRARRQATGEGAPVPARPLPRSLKEPFLKPPRDRQTEIVAPPLSGAETAQPPPPPRPGPGRATEQRRSGWP